MRKILFILFFVAFLIPQLSAQSKKDSIQYSQDLLFAAYNNNMDSVLLLIKKGASLKYRDANQYTALMYAIQNNNLDLVKLLVFNGAELNTSDYYRNTPLIQAVRNGFFDIAEYLCYSGAKRDQTNVNGATALHYAAYNNDYYIIDMLFFYGADVHAKAKDGNQPIHLAASGGDTAVLHLFIRNKADLLAQNQDDEDPLDIAIQYAGTQYCMDLFNAIPKDSLSEERWNQWLTTAVHFNNQEILDSLQGKVPPQEQKIINQTENPLLWARHYHSRSQVKQLKTMGYQMGFRPFISRVFFSTNFNFNNKDNHTSFVFGLSDSRYLMDAYLSFGTRFKRKKVLIPAGDHVFYQYWERRNFLALGLAKRFYPLKQLDNLHLFGGFELQAHFGSYRGSDRKFDQYFYPTINGGLAYAYRFVLFSLKWQYLNWGIYQTPAHFYSFGLGFQLNTISKPSAFQINWL